MPTFEWQQRFGMDLGKLGPVQRAEFQIAVRQFIDDLGLISKHGPGAFRDGLRVKGVHGTQGVYEMRWAPDGRATFEFGKPVHGRDPHIIWRRVGNHDVYNSP
jgi:hypothetical protein